jgi:putative membrane protein
MKYKMTEDKMPDRSSHYLANERTFLAWLRTCVAIIGLGFVVSRFGLFLRELGIHVKGNLIAEASIHSYSSLLGISMVILGAVLIIYSLKNYLETHKAIQRGIYTPKHSPIYALTIGVVIFSIIIAFYLFSL